ncbi:MAG TPA: metal-dependent hydrolase [Casimicrobiaceae bacterium]|nr:metal-dependent hydrolase [Casimicrobiaceae bacterium]
MDNVTHTLIGALLGETADRIAPHAGSETQARARRTLFLSVMVVGSNLPDCDILYSWWTGNKLDYLLEHRGYTHTVIGALIGSASMLVACEAWQRWRRMDLSARDRGWLVGLAILAPLLHIAMDSFNTYGVHPWWPIDNRWHYGDAVLIVEPLFWAAAAPLAFSLRSLVTRWFVVLPLVAAIYLAVVTQIVTVASIAVFGVLAIAMLALGRYARPVVALVCGIGVWLVTTAAFTIESGLARARVDAYATAQWTHWTTLDRVLTPMPINPFCWELILIQVDGDAYALRRAILSTAPASMLRFQCPMRGMARDITALLRPVDAPDAPFLHWHGEIVLARERLRELAASSCEVQALMRFARAPWFTDRVVGDLRYDREPGLGFAELDLTRLPPCPAYMPPWVPPRSDLLSR